MAHGMLPTIDRVAYLVDSLDAVTAISEPKCHRNVPSAGRVRTPNILPTSVSTIHSGPELPVLYLGDLIIDINPNLQRATYRHSFRVRHSLRLLAITAEHLHVAVEDYEELVLNDLEVTQGFVSPSQVPEMTSDSCM